MYSITLVFFYSGKPYIVFFLTGMRGNQFFAPVETGTLTAGEDDRRKGYLFIIPAKIWEQTQGTLRGELDAAHGNLHFYTDAVIADGQTLRGEKDSSRLGRERLKEEDKEEDGEEMEI